ncbi:MAG: hypothetical protein BWY77_00565 [bacterium ADurb.Bin431]|nr:MAG: hypothetical protein BWY77_00565 [bacterium ADurb.Bin431]
MWGEVAVLGQFAVPVHLVDLKGDLPPASLDPGVDIDIAGIGAEEIAELSARDHNRVEGPFDAGAGQQSRDSREYKQNEKCMMLIL